MNPFDRIQRKLRNTKKAVVVTGCSSGIGKSIAERLVAHDFLVFATTRNVADAKRLSDLRKKENLIPVSPLDLTLQEEIYAAAESIKSNLQCRGCHGLSGIISNAGGGSIAH